MGGIIAKSSAVVAWVAALGLAVLLVQLGAPVGVALTSAALLVGLTLFLAGRALTNMDPESGTGALMIVPGTVLLFVTAVCCLLLGKEYWPHANAFLLFAGGLVTVVVLCALGGTVVDRIVPPRRSQDPDFQMIDTSAPQAREFFGDSVDRHGRSM